MIVVMMGGGRRMGQGMALSVMDLDVGSLPLD
jgi:hypothetical protein